jgi:hypothetical protein
MGIFDFLGGGDYGASGYKDAYQGTLGQEGAVAGQFGNLGATTGQNFQNYNNGSNNAIASYAKLLQQSPYTDAYSTSAINQANSGLSSDYLGAKSALAADMAARGFGGPGQSSSMLAGGLTDIEGQRAGQLANSQNQLAQAKIARQYTNAADLTNLYGGAASNAFGQTGQALGNQAGILGNVGQGQFGLYQNALQQQRDNANGVMGFLGSLGNIAGTFMGAPGAGTAATTLAGGVTPGYDPSAMANYAAANPGVAAYSV